MECPECKEKINDNATKCRYCEAKIEPENCFSQIGQAVVALVGGFILLMIISFIIASCQKFS